MTTRRPLSSSGLRCCRPQAGWTCPSFRGPLLQTQVFWSRLLQTDSTSISSVQLVITPSTDVSPHSQVFMLSYSHSPYHTGTSPYRIPPKAPGLREDVFIVLATDTNGEAAASVLKIDDPTISPPTTSAPGLDSLAKSILGAQFDL